MIDNEKYLKVLELGLILDHYHILSLIKNNEPLPKSKRVRGFINLLTKKGYIRDNVLSDTAMLLVDDYITTTTSCTTTTAPSTEEGTFNFNDWAKGLHGRCQKLLKELTGSNQVRDKINKKAYSFLPNSLDLGKVIYKVMVLYNIKDLDAIEKCIMNHIRKCHREKCWFPLMKYYIFKSDGPLAKEGKSDLVTDLENLGDNDLPPDSKSTQKFV